MAHSQVALAGIGGQGCTTETKRTAWWKLAVAAVLVIGMGTLLTYVFNGKPAESKESPAQIASADKPGNLPGQNRIWIVLPPLHQQ